MRKIGSLLPLTFVAFIVMFLPNITLVDGFPSNETYDAALDSGMSPYSISEKKNINNWKCNYVV